jgi:hypothetical protein
LGISAAKAQSAVNASATAGILKNTTVSSAKSSFFLNRPKMLVVSCFGGFSRGGASRRLGVGRDQRHLGVVRHLCLPPE